MTFIVFYIPDQHNFCDQHHALARNKAQTDARGGSDKVTTGVTNYSKRTLSDHFRRLGDQQIINQNFLKFLQICLSYIINISKVLL